MRSITYYVATSLDGFICGPNEDISGFVQEGSGVSEYLMDLQEYDTVIMGRKTYEFGYQYGLAPGQPAYAQMQHFIFSESMSIDNSHELVKVVPRDIEFIKELKTQRGSDIYLCGGGVIAGWLLEHQLIDELKIKLNPFIAGSGTQIFVHNKVPKMPQLELLSSHSYDHGLQIIEYRIKYVT
jgi:dihydrofolate reductase